MGEAPPEKPFNCGGNWGNPNHWMFQTAHTCLLISYLANNSLYGILFLHGVLIIAFLFLSIWGWLVICAIDVFAWNFAFMIINILQFSALLYKVRPIPFAAELEDVYQRLFKPLKVPRYMFRTLIAPEYCTILTLPTGDRYAVPDVTATDRLALCLSGVAEVVAENGKVMHRVTEMQFFDSPEFESGSGEKRFKVMITAIQTCRYIFWKKQALDFIYLKDPYLATVMGTITSRDIADKLFDLNQQVQITSGKQTDIRLPGVYGKRKESIVNDEAKDVSDDEPEEEKEAKEADKDK